MRSLLVGLGMTATLGTVLAVGCGGNARPLVSDTGGAGGGGSAGVTEAGAPDKPPGCGQTDTGAQCDCVDVALYTNPPTMYFVLDRSGSMALDGNWDKVRGVVGQIMRALGPRAKFGATEFPAPGGLDCNAGREVLAITPGDPPSATKDGPATATLLNATISTPSGGTPTSATLEAVRAKLRGVDGQKYVIIATDGAPNCNLQASCSSDQCQDNIDGYNGCYVGGPSCCDKYPGDCNDETAAVTQLNGLKADGVTSFVIGLPAAARYSLTLDNMAIAGGNPLPTVPRYYAVGATSDSILAALKSVAAKITATCEYDLTTTPASTALVNVYIDEVVVPQDPVNGWTINGKVVTLTGTVCDRVKSGDALDVRIIAGCPTVILK